MGAEVSAVGLLVLGVAVGARVVGTKEGASVVGNSVTTGASVGKPVGACVGMVGV